MIKNKLDYKLVNTALVVLIIYLMYHTGYLWIGIFSKIIKIIFPFFLSFVLAYALYPFLKWLIEHKIPKGLGVIIIISIILIIMALIISMVVPLLAEQLGSFFDAIMAFIRQVSDRFEIDSQAVQKVLDNGFDNIIANVSKHVSNGAIKIINVSLAYISTGLIIFSAAIYFLLDMKKIRSSVKKYLMKKSKRIYRYIAILDNEMKNYLSGIIKVMIITMFEYSIAYFIIGHPNAILLGMLATIGTLIPYFGGIATNIVAAVTSFVVSPALFVRTCITFVILSGVDSYLINPYVCGKTNNVHPLIVIFSVFAGGIIFGTFGVMISFPVAVIIIATYKFFKADINDKISDIKKSS